jgi:hypothetical protein
MPALIQQEGGFPKSLITDVQCPMTNEIEDLGLRNEIEHSKIPSFLNPQVH